MKENRGKKPATCRQQAACICAHSRHMISYYIRWNYTNNIGNILTIRAMVMCAWIIHMAIVHQLVKSVYLYRHPGEFTFALAINMTVKMDKWNEMFKSCTPCVCIEHIIDTHLAIYVQYTTLHFDSINFEQYSIK